MLSSVLFTLVHILTIALGSACALPARRQILNSDHGTISAPAAGTAIVPGEVFAFNYDQANACESGYSPISVFLLTQPVSSDTITSDGEVTEDDLLFDFGDYLIANFGLPQMDTPPPADFTMPDLPSSGNVTSLSGTTLYLAVIETFRDCPPDIPLEYGLTNTPITYGASSSS